MRTRVFSLVVSAAMFTPSGQLQAENRNFIASNPITPAQAKWVAQMADRGRLDDLQRDPFGLARPGALERLAKNTKEARRRARSRYEAIRFERGFREVGTNVLIEVDHPILSRGAKALGALDRYVSEKMLDAVFNSGVSPESSLKLRELLSKAEGRDDRVELVRQELAFQLADKEQFLSLAPTHREAFLFETLRLAAEVISDHEDRLVAVESVSKEARENALQVAIECTAARLNLKKSIESIRGSTTLVSSGLEKSLSDEALSFLDKKNSVLGVDFDLAKALAKTDVNWRGSLMVLGDNLTNYSSGIRSCVEIATKLGLDGGIAEEVVKASDYGSAVAKLATAVGAQDPLSALNAVAGIMGIGSPDPSIERHMEVMGTLYDIKKLQLETLRKIDQLEVRIDRLREIVVRSELANRLQLSYLIDVEEESRIGKIGFLQSRLSLLANCSTLEEAKSIVGSESFRLDEARAEFSNLLEPTTRSWWRIAPSGHLVGEASEEANGFFYPLAVESQRNLSPKVDLLEPCLTWSEWMLKEQKVAEPREDAESALESVLEGGKLPIDPYKVTIAGEVAIYNETFRPIFDNAETLFRDGTIDDQLLRFSAEKISLVNLEQMSRVVDSAIVCEHLFAGPPILQYLIAHPIGHKDGLDAEGLLGSREALILAPRFKRNFGCAFVRSKLAERKGSLVEYIYSYSSEDPGRILRTLGGLPEGWTLHLIKEGDSCRYSVRSLRRERALFDLPSPVEISDPKISYGPSLPALIDIRGRLIQQIAMTKLTISDPASAAILRDEALIMNTSAAGR